MKVRKVAVESLSGSLVGGRRAVAGNPPPLMGQAPRGAAAGAWRAAIAAASLALAGCATTPLANQTDALSKAAEALKTSAQAPSQIPVADAAQAKAVLIYRLVSGGPSALAATCSDDAVAWRDSVIAAADLKAENAAYKRYRALRTCPSGPAANPVAADAAAATALAALDGYLDALNAIVAAKDSGDVQAAAQAADRSLTALAQAANAPPPLQAAPGFFDKLVGMALAQAQYEALRDSVLRIDPLLDAAAPYLVRALRVAQAREIAEVDQDAKTAMTAIDGALNAPAVRTSVGDRLALYDRLSPIVDELTAAQQASRVDPAPKIRSLVDAHHKLAEAIRSRHGEAATVIANAADMAGAAKDLVGSVAAPVPAATKPGAKPNG